MIPQRIQALFTFIDYLDRHKVEYVSKYLPVCEELYILHDERSKLRCDENYKQRLRHNELQAEIQKKMEPILANIFIPVSDKLRELGIWSGDETYASLWNNNIPSIVSFKENFDPDDIQTVITAKKKYLLFRSETNTEFLCLTFAFHGLDQVLKILFDYFKGSNENENEFESFQAKTIVVNDIKDVVEHLKQDRSTYFRYSLGSDAEHHNVTTNVNYQTQSIIQVPRLPSVHSPDEVYNDVLNTLFTYGKELEKKPKIFQHQDEEGLRDHFVSILTGRYPGTTATGETFNKSGKTDILLKDDQGNNLFIAECKWWTGPGGFHATINQLFDSYLTWRDTRVAILLFVGNKHFSNVVNQIEQEAKNHPCCLEYLNVKEKTRFSFRFSQKENLSNDVQMEIMLFHFHKSLD